jgi:hypothetical protein
MLPWIVMPSRIFGFVLCPLFQGNFGPREAIAATGPRRDIAGSGLYRKEDITTVEA